MKAAFRRFLAAVLARQSRRLIKAHHLKVVAVCGSVGKTTTRSAIVSVLRQKYKTQAINQPGYNSDIGLPLSIFDMRVPRLLLNPFAWVWRLVKTEAVIHGRYDVDILVLELGTDHPGEIEHFLTYLRPDVGVITAITPEHMENFDSLDDVAAEELQLVSASKYILATSLVPKAYKQKYIANHPHHDYYGSQKSADFQIKVSSADLLSGMIVTISRNGRHVLKDVSLKLFGQSAALSALAAYAVGDKLGLNSGELKVGLEKIHPVSGRMRVLHGLNDSVIVDDSYNSSPAAVVASLDALYQSNVTGRRIAVLGSMNELGDNAPQYHTEAGASAAGLDLLVTLGELASSYLGPAAVHAGLDPTRLKPADSPVAAADFLRVTLRPGDVVLIKGSQNGVFSEEVTKRLLADPADVSHLVRQSSGWLKQKSKQFPGL
jgi:UDP-N-acetylmuramoyl-tripeptide--D-alanyl-D-alanine ligase